MIKQIAYFLIVASFTTVANTSATAQEKAKSLQESSASLVQKLNEPKQIDGMSLVWSDEFSTNGQANSTNWGYEYGFVRNKELQWYQSQNAYCQDGKLIITAKRERVNNPYYNELSGNWRMNRKFAEYTSACLITKGLREWDAGGYFEIRAKIDTSLGSWPAIWLLGTNEPWPFCGEIDMMEFYRRENRSSILANAAWGMEKNSKVAWDTAVKPLKYFLAKDPNWADKFHVWSMKWSTSQIQLYLDNELMNSIELSKTINPDGTNPFVMPKKFYVLLNLAIGSNGGDPARSNFPITFQVDYIRIYKTKN